MPKLNAALRWFVLMGCAFVLAGCQRGLWLNPPSDEHRTALVLPVELDNRAQFGKHGFEYIYRIEATGGDVEPLEVHFRFPIKGDMVIVDSLPPGNYRVSQFRFQPRGSGNFTYGNNIRPRNDRFRLEPGQITILNRSLNVLVVNQTPGRGKSRSYGFDVDPLRHEQRERVIDALRQLEHFDRWTIYDENRPAASLELRGNWTGSWTMLTESSTDNERCQPGELTFSIDNQRLDGRGIAADGAEIRLSARFDSGGYLRGELTVDQAAVGKMTGRLYNDKRILGSFSYRDGCEAQWKARLRDDGLSLMSPEAIPTDPPQPVPGSVTDVALEGYYRSEITSDHHAVFRLSQHRRMKIRFTQDGDRVTGAIEGTEQTIEGLREGDIVRFRYTPPGFGYDIEGRWSISGSGSRLEGDWLFNAYGASGDWNLVRLAP